MGKFRVLRLKDGDAKIIGEHKEEIKSQFIKRKSTVSKIAGGFSVGDSVMCYLNKCIAEIVRIHSNGDLELSAAGVTLKSNMNSVQRYYGKV